MNKIIFLLFTTVLAMLSSLSFAEEPPKMKLLHQDWKEKNSVNIEQVQKQRQAIIKIAGPKFNQHQPNPAILKAFGEILWCNPKVKENVKSELHLAELIMKENAIAGYVSQATSSKSHHDTPLMPDNSLGIMFKIDSNQFVWMIGSETTIEQKLGDNHGYISCIMVFYENVEEAKTKILGYVISQSNVAYDDQLQLYQLDHGPGDACLVPVSTSLGNPISDKRLLFVHGNIAIYLVSYYEDFGCMDLAYRIDAYLMEQMKTQMSEKEKKDKQESKP